MPQPGLVFGYSVLCLFLLLRVEGHEGYGHVDNTDDDEVDDTSADLLGRLPLVISGLLGPGHGVDHGVSKAVDPIPWLPMPLKGVISLIFCS